MHMAFPSTAHHGVAVVTVVSLKDSGRRDFVISRENKKNLKGDHIVLFFGTKKNGSAELAQLVSSSFRFNIRASVS
jgi:hypothetical protein